MTDVIVQLAEQYASRFREKLGPIRRVGREMEFPLVERDGTAGDIRRLWPHLMCAGQFRPKYDDPETRSLIVALNGDECVYEAEVGLGTVEVLVGPCDDLFELEALATRALTRLVRVPDARGCSAPSASTVTA